MTYLFQRLVVASLMECHYALLALCLVTDFSQVGISCLTLNSLLEELAWRDNGACMDVWGTISIVMALGTNDWACSGAIKLLNLLLRRIAALSLSNTSHIAIAGASLHLHLVQLG